MKLVTIIGARPQFIKALVVSHVFEKFGEDVEEIQIQAGQHCGANI